MTPVQQNEAQVVALHHLSTMSLVSVEKKLEMKQHRYLSCATRQRKDRRWQSVLRENHRALTECVIVQDNFFVYKKSKSCSPPPAKKTLHYFFPLYYIYSEYIPCKTFGKMFHVLVYVIFIDKIEAVPDSQGPVKIMPTDDTRDSAN